MQQVWFVVFYDQQLTVFGLMIHVGRWWFCSNDMASVQVCKIGYGGCLMGSCRRMDTSLYIYGVVG